MAIITKTQIEINGKPVNDFIELVIHERMAAHHEFEVICRMDKLEAKHNTFLQDWEGRLKSLLNRIWICAKEVCFLEVL